MLIQLGGLLLAGSEKREFLGDFSSYFLLSLELLATPIYTQINPLTAEGVLFFPENATKARP